MRGALQATWWWPNWWDSHRDITTFRDSNKAAQYDHRSPKKFLFISSFSLHGQMIQAVRLIFTVMNNVLPTRVVSQVMWLKTVNTLLTSPDSLFITTLRLTNIWFSSFSLVLYSPAFLLLPVSVHPPSWLQTWNLPSIFSCLKTYEPVLLYHSTQMLNISSQEHFNINFKFFLIVH